MLKRNKVIISGRVTGVYFRRFIYDHSIRLNLKGYVKNINHKVEAVFEGLEENVNKMIELCKIGTPLAKVERVEVFTETIKKDEEFRIIN